MKKTIFFSFATAIILCVSSCKQENQYPTEDKIMDCVYTDFESKNVDVKGEFDAFEQQLIKHNYLKSSSGKSYKELLTRYSQEGKLMFSDNFKSELKDINELPIDLVENNPCMDAVTFEEIQDSHLMKFISLYGSLSRSDTVNDKVIASYAAQIFSEDDLEHDLYKSLALIFIYSLNMNDEIMNMFGSFD